MSKDLQLSRALAGGSFLVMGRAGMDLMPKPDGTAIEEASNFWADLGGSAANVAVGLVRQGARAALLTSLSDDAVGRFCLQRLRHYGVQIEHVAQKKGEQRSSLALSETRLTEHQTVIYRNNAADFHMDIDQVRALDFTRFDALVTAGTVFAAEPSRAASFYAFEKASEMGLPIIFDIDYRPYSWASPKEAAQILSRAGALADVIVGNDEEFGFMAGDFAQGLTKARSLLGQNEGAAQLVIYKMGHKGAVTFVQKESIPTGIYEVEALKPTGAGDGFLAGFLAAQMQGLPLKDALLRGSAMAAYVVARAGCAPAMPDGAALSQFIASHSGPSRPPMIT